MDVVKGLKILIKPSRSTVVWCREGKVKEEDHIGFSQCCLWIAMSSVIWHCIVGWVVPGVLKEHSAFIIKGRLVLYDPWSWSHCVLLKCQEPLTLQHNVTSLKTSFLKEGYISCSMAVQRIVTLLDHSQLGNLITVIIQPEKNWNCCEQNSMQLTETKQLQTVCKSPCYEKVLHNLWCLWNNMVSCFIHNLLLFMHMIPSLASIIMSWLYTCLWSWFS
jgi:hypothetical protein